ncbi:MAG: hypothetical protein HKN15_13550 [Xanthomonadales bacterium]|nr:hypothetical protein [Xanthomonadales bacterium]
MSWRVALAALAILLVSACGSEPTLEQQIIAVINEMEENAETVERRDFMSRIDESFVGQEGELDRDSFQRFMFYQWSQNQRLHAQLFPITVVRQGVNSAGASFKVLVTGGPNLLPDRGQLFDVTTTWIKQDDRWMLARANWVPTSEAMQN